MNTVAHQHHVYIIEKDEIIYHGLKLLFSAIGYVVNGALSGVKGLRKIHEFQHSDTPVDLVICDHKLPDISGLEVVSEVRKKLDIGVIMFSENKDSNDRIQAFKHGADDYICKGIAPAELILRVKALLKRTIKQFKEKKPAFDIEFADYKLNSQKRLLQLPSLRKIKLTEAENKLLLALLSYKGEVVSRSLLAQECQLAVCTGNSRTIDVLISRLRYKLGHDTRNQVILSFRGKGYLLIT